MTQRIQPRILISAALTGALVSVVSGGAAAATITVSATCSLANAVQSSNTRSNVGGCTRTGTANPERIVLPQGNYFSGVELTLSRTVTIVGNGTGAELETAGVYGFGAFGSATSLPTVTFENIRIKKYPPSQPVFFGIWADDANLVLNNVQVSGATNGVWASVRDRFDPTLSIDNSRIFGNFGAGVKINEVSSSIRRTTITGNSGGGIEYEGDTDAQMVVDSCLISSNTGAVNGGGIYSFGQSRILNSTIVNNSASGEGGGIYHNGQELTLWHLTVTGNQSGGVGGGVRWTGSQGYFIYSIVAGNTGAGSSPDVNLGVSSAGRFRNLIGAVNGFESFFDNTNLVGTTASPRNPRLATLASNGGPTQTRALLSNSPAIDFIPNTNYFQLGPSAVDQRGLGRPADGNGDGISRYDIGAFERRP